jgi:hypothetical protein
MKQKSEMEENLFTSSLNICPEETAVESGRVGGVTPPEPEFVNV